MKRWHGFVLAVGVIYLYLPIAVLFLFAFHDAEVMAFPFRGPTLRWFSELAANQPYIDGLVTSLAIAVPVGILSATLGLMGALALQAAVKARSATWVIGFAVLLMVPFLAPKAVLGVAQAMVIAQVGLDRGPVVLALSQTLVILPFTTALLASVLLAIDPRLEEAARDCGASAFTRFRLVLFPLLRGVFVAAVSIGVILSLADVTLAQFLSGGAQTLSMVVASRFLREMQPDINAVQVILLSLTALFVVLAEVLRRRRMKRVAVR
jgi:spermidine/putrescine transport system permease protein